MKHSIGVIGAGSWGTALALHISKLTDVGLWFFDKNKADRVLKDRVSGYLPNIILNDRICITSDIDQFLKQYEVLVLAVPSSGLFEIIKKIAIYNHKKFYIVNATKGLEGVSGDFFSHIISETVKTSHNFVLSGPSFAIEVAQNLPTAVVLSGEKHESFNEVLPFFHHNNMRVYENHDPIGVQLAGCYKNVIAVASGISHGLALGKNAQAALITRGIAEMSRLGKKTGADFKTFLGLAGLGDLTLTATSTISRNYRFGAYLAKNNSIQDSLKEVGQVVEGAENCSTIYLMGKKYQIELPIVNELFKILKEGKSPQQALIDLLNRDPVIEF